MKPQRRALPPAVAHLILVRPQDTRAFTCRPAKLHFAHIPWSTCEHFEKALMFTSVALAWQWQTAFASLSLEPKYRKHFWSGCMLRQSVIRWTDGFGVVHPADNILIGLCSFGGPPTREGIVEISYGIAPSYRGHGFATQAAEMLMARALASGCVQTLRAHTSPEQTARQRRAP